MSELLHELITRRETFVVNKLVNKAVEKAAATESATSSSPGDELRGDSTAIIYRGEHLSYSDLARNVTRAASAMIAANLEAAERVAVYLPKRFETVIALFGASRAGGVFVPVNPLLKADQAAYILQNCNVRILVTSHDRANLLTEQFHHLPDLHTVVLVDGEDKEPIGNGSGQRKLRVMQWNDFLQSGGPAENPDLADMSGFHRRIDTDMASILYTSGSTGKPKGVVLSHKNMVTGAKSVSQYLENTAADRLLAVLPFSFDYGLSQLTTAFNVGASVVLMDYLFPRDVIKMVAKENITGLAAVPPLWAQVAAMDWPDEARQTLRYITNSGGAMPVKVIDSLRAQLPRTQVYLMYGLTEAFRSSYLPPSEIDKRPESMGKAIPNAELMVVREDGSPCAPNEPGELVHRGSLVALGYWGDPVKTAERFKPVPNQIKELPLTEMAVWSGDTVRKDEEGFLYFIGRKDDMIKTSGYRVSPTEVEEVIYATGKVQHVAAIGVPHPVLGQGIIAIVSAIESATDNAQSLTDELIAACKQKLPAFMVPLHFDVRSTLQKNPNGKIDRKILVEELKDFFNEDI